MLDPSLEVMELNGLPLHPLVVHAAVVFAPLAALAAILFAWVPRWRRVLRRPAVGLALFGALWVQAAQLTGKDLKHSLGLHSSLLQSHEMWAGRLVAHSWVLLAVVLVAGWVLPTVTAGAAAGGIVDGSDRAGLATQAGSLNRTIVARVFSVLVTLAALALLFVAFKTGDAGARMVWASQ